MYPVSATLRSFDRFTSHHRASHLHTLRKIPTTSSSSPTTTNRTVALFPHIDSPSPMTVSPTPRVSASTSTRALQSRTGNFNENKKSCNPPWIRTQMMPFPIHLKQYPHFHLNRRPQFPPSPTRETLHPHPVMPGLQPPPSSHPPQSRRRTILCVSRDKPTTGKLPANVQTFINLHRSCEISLASFLGTSVAGNAVELPSLAG